MVVWLELLSRDACYVLVDAHVKSHICWSPRQCFRHFPTPIIYCHATSEDTCKKISVVLKSRCHVRCSEIAIRNWSWKSKLLQANITLHRLQTQVGQTAQDNCSRRQLAGPPHSSRSSGRQRHLFRQDLYVGFLLAMVSTVVLLPRNQR